MQYEGPNRRRHTRYEFVAQVEVRGSDEVVMLILQDVSTGGAQLSLTSADSVVIEVGTKLEVFVDLGSDDAGENLTANLDAKVVRVIPGAGRGHLSLGVEWVDLSPYSATQLGRIIERAADHHTATQ